MRYFVTFPSGEEVAVELTHVPTGELVVQIDGRVVPVDVVAQESSTTMSIGGRIVDLWLEGDPPDVGCVTGPYRFYAKVESERMRALAAAFASRGPAAGEGVVIAPMPGRVLKVLVNEGDAIEVGAPLVVLEAMKMENEIVAGRAGTVTRVYVKPGDTVEGAAKLVEVH